MWLFPEVTLVWGVSVVAILDSSVNCVCVWSTKKLTMPAYFVAPNCNNLQTTPGTTMHELLHNWTTVRQMWIKFIQFKRADFFAAPHHAHLCSKHFSECDFANPMEYQYSFKILPGWLKLIWLYPCGSLGQSISFIFGARVGHFAATPQRHSRYMVTWFGRHGDAFSTTENAFFRAFITLRPQFHLHHRSQWALTEIVSKITPNLGLVL